MEQRDPKSLRAHPLSLEIYRDGVTPDLLESIREKGIYEPLLVTWEGTVVSGHRRLACALELDLAEVPTVDTGLTDPMDIEEAVIEANRYREKTEEQKAREFAHLLPIETKRAADRQKASQAQTGDGVILQAGGTVGKNVSPPLEPEGKAAAVAASRVGMSRPTATKAAEVVTVIDALEAKGKPEEAAAIRETLNTKSTRKAHKQAAATGLLAPKTEAKPSAKATHKKQTFNLTNDKIEWARWTWNPVTGCEHGCEYCYARDIAEPPGKPTSDAFPYGFKPAIREERLTAPKDMGKPEDHIQQLAKATAPKGTEDLDPFATAAKQGIGYKTVFAVSMGDLFGEWVPQAWIDSVLDAIREGPDWNFLFLTKNPERMTDIQWPPNAWVGTTVDCQERVTRAQEAFRGVEATVRFLSCEPLTQELVFDDLSMFDWLIIGGQSRPREPALQPELMWVSTLLAQAAAFDVRVYCKPNLTVLKEYPA